MDAIHVSSGDNAVYLMYMSVKCMCDIKTICMWHISVMCKCMHYAFDIWHIQLYGITVCMWHAYVTSKHPPSCMHVTHSF